MTQPIDAMKYEVTGVHDSGGVQRGLLNLGCGNGCQIPLRSDGPKAATWGWNGNADTPSVVPSIACTKCGFHRTLTNGVWA